MRDELLDLVSHTHDLGCIDFIKIEGEDNKTDISGLAADRSVVVQANFLTPVNEFKGTFGMPNLSNLKSLLSIAEYEDGKITVKREDRNDTKNTPVSLYFQNKTDDFNNNYRFMVSDVVNNALSGLTFNISTWDVEFAPSSLSIQRLKLQAQAIPEVKTFTVATEDNSLIFQLGEEATHSGSFTFQNDITGNINKNWKYPIRQVINILDLSGDKHIYISDMGAMKITVNSGIASYDYILPAMTK